VEWIEHLIDQRLKRALDRLDAAPLNSDAHSALAGMVVACTQREH